MGARLGTDVRQMLDLVDGYWAGRAEANSWIAHAAMNDARRRQGFIGSNSWAPSGTSRKSYPPGAILAINSSSGRIPYADMILLLKLYIAAVSIT